MSGKARKKSSDGTSEKAKSKAKFLKSLAQCGVVTHAAEDAGSGRRTMYAWRDEDEAFALAWDSALDDSADRLEKEAHRRATEGVLEPVYQGGELVGHIRKYSDTLLIFLLKGAKPAKFRERFEHMGPGGERLGLTWPWEIKDTHGTNGNSPNASLVATIGSDEPGAVSGSRVREALGEDGA